MVLLSVRDVLAKYFGSVDLRRATAPDSRAAVASGSYCGTNARCRIFARDLSDLRKLRKEVAALPQRFDMRTYITDVRELHAYRGRQNVIYGQDDLRHLFQTEFTDKLSHDRDLADDLVADRDDQAVGVTARYCGKC